MVRGVWVSGRRRGGVRGLDGELLSWPQGPTTVLTVMPVAPCRSGPRPGRRTRWSGAPRSGCTGRSVVSVGALSAQAGATAVATACSRVVGLDVVGCHFADVTLGVGRVL